MINKESLHVGISFSNKPEGKNTLLTYKGAKKIKVTPDFSLETMCTESWMKYLKCWNKQTNKNQPRIICPIKLYFKSEHFSRQAKIEGIFLPVGPPCKKC